MKATIHDREALKAISPAALAAYARSAGWQRGEAYRVHSHVYVGQDRPEIIVPQTDHLGDYATVVSTLIGVFAQVADQDELTIYRSLVTGDRQPTDVRWDGVDSIMTPDQIRETFRYHPPTPAKVQRYERIRAIIREAALEIGELTPPSRERYLCLTRLQEAMMMANASIAIHTPD